VYNLIIEVYRTNQQYEQTSDIQQLDLERDEQFITFKVAVDYYKRGGTPAQKSAAKAIDYLLKPYRYAAGRSYANNTAELRDFMRDMQVAPYAAHLATLGLTDAVATLQAANEAFDALYNDRSKVVLHRTQLETIREGRHQWDELYRTMATVLPALHLTEVDAAKKESIAVAIDTINAFVVQLHKTLDRRSVKPSDVDADADANGTSTDPETPPSGDDASLD
jgi:hypothetical protein